MTYQTTTDPLSEAQASMTSIGRAIRSRPDEVAANISRHGACVGKQKTLSL